MKVKVKDGSKRKKFLHVLDHDVSTTGDFGFCQPIMARELSADDTVNLSIPQFVRLGVVVKPTFGRLHLRTYNKFVPVESIYEPWGSMMAGQSYSHGGNNSYIPTQVYTCRVDVLWKLCCLHSQIAVFSVDGSKLDNLTLVKEFQTQDIINANYSNVINNFFYGDNVTTTFQTSVETIINRHTQWRDNIINSTTVTQDDCSLTSYDWIYMTTDQAQDVVIMCGRFSRAGKNLRSILIGCGYQFNLALHEERSILPIMAYYKSYFDLFNPNREYTWKDCNMYQFTEAVNTYNRMSCDKYLLNSSTSYITNAFLSWFLEDLPQCYYTFNPDFVSAHISGTALPVANQVENEAGYAADAPYSARDFIDSYDHWNAVGSISQNSVPSMANPVAQEGFGGITRSSLRILDALTKRINAHSAIGTRISEYLRSVFGSSYLENDVVDNIGSQNLDIDISDVMSFAETSEGALGEYAGRGIGAIDSNSAEKFNFKAPEVGYLVSMIAIVPESRFSQGIDPLLSHVKRQDFFDPDFDGITLLPTQKSCIYGVSEFGNTDYGASFGNIPIYSEYKIANNILNGDMSRMSTRTTFLPFTLDRLLPYGGITLQTVQGQSTWILSDVASSAITNGTIWRYCALYRWLGQYNRIFLDEGTDETYHPEYYDYYDFFGDMGWPEDNFIIHNHIRLKVHSYALPLSDSFDTGSLDGATMQVEKA